MSDTCTLCQSVRVDEDDDGHGGAVERRRMGSGVCWVTVRGRRVCGACVFEIIADRLDGGGPPLTSRRRAPP